MRFRWARTLALTSIAVAIPCIRHLARGNAPSPQGLHMVLVHSCSSAELENRGDSSDIWLRYLSNRRAFINEEPTASTAAPVQVAYITSTRIEKVIWLAADPNLSYAEVASDIAEFAKRTPALVIFLTTSSETGSIDPTESQRQHTPPSFVLCQPRGVSANNAVVAANLSLEEHPTSASPPPPSYS